LLHDTVFLEQVDSYSGGQEILFIFNNHKWTLSYILRQSDAAGFEVLTVVRMKMAVFRVVEPCSLVEVY
jgi:hypothetical protein